MTQPVPIMLVKFGGSLITDKAGGGGLRPARLRKIARAVAAATGPSAPNLVIVLGGGSIGHRAAVRYGLAEGAVIATQIHRMSRSMFLLKCRLAQALERFDIAGLPFHETSTLLAEGATVSCQAQAMASAIGKGFIPILSGGPVLSSQGMVAFNSDRIGHALIASGCFKLERFILFSDAPGVIGKSGEVIRILTEANLDEVANLKLREGVVDVSGAMMSKVETGLDLARLGVETMICGLDGLEPLSFSNILKFGAVLGTRIPALKPLNR